MDKAKIVLISPFAKPILAIGLRIISAYLKENGHEVKMIFLPTDNIGHIHSDFVCNQIIDLCRDADIIGFTSMSLDFITVSNLTDKIKAKLDIPVIWGGIHINIKPEECLKHADIICRGEGEEAMLELANNIKSGNIENIKNLWLKKDGQIIKNDIRPLEDDLDKYPFQDYDIEDHYILFHEHIVQMTTQLLFRFLTTDKDGAEYELLTARNCPHNCTYCNNNFLRKMYSGKGKYVRQRSIENVIQEIAEITKKFDIFTSVAIKDDVFFIRKTDNIREFCDQYKEKINLPIRCNLSPMYMVEEKFRLLIEAGMHKCAFGIQSFNENTLHEIYKRNCSKQQILDTVNIVSKFPGETQYHFIIDNPFETRESLMETLMFITDLPRNVELLVFSLVPFPGTDMYEMTRMDNYIESDFESIYTKKIKSVVPQQKSYIPYLIHLCKYLKNKKEDPQKVKRLIRFLASKPIVILCDNTIFLSTLNVYLKAKNRLKRIRKKFKDTYHI